ncbi:hypothetical protein F5883DRAFT_550895 [Diaporthe sp. PMI_573]|nr:hypothetical protein F5883DRAFT_550895 [Diaporthaceae sp. PMI_573]
MRLGLCAARPCRTSSSARPRTASPAPPSPCSRRSATELPRRRQAPRRRQHRPRPCRPGAVGTWPAWRRRPRASSRSSWRPRLLPLISQSSPSPSCSLLCHCRPCPFHQTPRLPSCPSWISCPSFPSSARPRRPGRPPWHQVPPVPGRVSCPSCPSCPFSISS